MSQSGGSPYFSIIMLVGMFVVFYFLLIRPQQKQQKERMNQIKALKEGDKILTQGGVIGKVVSVKEDSVTIKSKESEMEISKMAVLKVLQS